jgi:hypothetical protein
MKTILTICSILFLLLASISIANARLICTTDRNGIQHCSGPNGTMVRGPGGNMAIVPNNHRHHHPHHRHGYRPRCTWINGVQICR